MFKRVRRESPAAYLKVCAMLVPREMKVEHSQGVKAMSDEQIEAAIELIKSMLEARAGDDAMKRAAIRLNDRDIIGGGP